MIEFNKINLKPYISYAKMIADERHKQKKNYSTSNPMSSNYELVGILGELVYQIEIGENFDYRLLAEGDTGDDFKFGVNVKTSEEHKAKHLIEYTDKKNPDVYVFCIVNLEKEYGYVYGWILGEAFKRFSKTIDFGYGDRKAMDLTEIRPFYTFPPLIQKNILNIHRGNEIINEYLNCNLGKLEEIGFNIFQKLKI